MSKESVVHAKELIRMVREKLDRLEKIVEEFETATWPRGPRPLQLRVDELAMVLQMYHEGKGLNRIAIKMGYSEEILRRALIEAGIPIRPRGGSKKQPTDAQMAARGLS